MGNCGYCKDAAIVFAKKNKDHSQLLLIASNRGKKAIEIEFGSLERLPASVLPDHRAVADSLRLENGYVRLFTLSEGKVEAVTDLLPNQISFKLTELHAQLTASP